MQSSLKHIAFILILNSLNLCSQNRYLVWDSEGNFFSEEQTDSITLLKKLDAYPFDRYFVLTKAYDSIDFKSISLFKNNFSTNRLEDYFILPCSDSFPNGLWTTYDRNDGLLLIWQTKEVRLHLLEGVKRDYSPYGITTVTYKSGFPVSPERTVSHAGILISETIYKDSLGFVLYDKQFYHNGQLHRFYNYQKLEYIEYYTTGELKTKVGITAFGSFSGYKYYYNKKGLLIKTEKYYFGALQD